MSRTTMKLQLYLDRMCPPARAVLIFCKVNGIEFEEVKIELMKGEHKSPEFKAINPMGQVPAIVHGTFKLFESHAILRYLACAFPGIPDHWCPADFFKRAKVESVLDWHHSNLRRGADGLIINSKVAPLIGLPLNPQAAAEAKKVLMSSLSTIESIWLEENMKFLLGNPEPSIADLALVCEIEELVLLDEKEHDLIMRPHKKVLQWIEDVKKATQPHFEEAHATLYEDIPKFHAK